MLIFVAAALGVIPCAAVMGEATEAIAARTGPGIGGLLNVTFGNAPELIIAFFALIEGLQEVVKASLVGSIIGNVLLVMGAAMIVGGWGREKQEFSRTAVSAQSACSRSRLPRWCSPRSSSSSTAASLPPVGADQVDFGSDLEHLSLGVSLVLLVSYGSGLCFSLKTHRDVFNPFGDETRRRNTLGRCRRAAIYLALAAVAVGVMSEILVGSITEASAKIGLSEFFVGVFVVAIVGNAAEHWVAVLVARQEQDGPGREHRGRLERSDRAVRGARAGAPLVRVRATTRWRSSSTDTSWARSCSR